MQASGNNAGVKLRAHLLFLLFAGCATPPVEAPPSPPELTPNFLGQEAIPILLRPQDTELVENPNFLAAVEAIQGENWRGAAILLQQLRQEFAGDSLVACHWWVLAQGEEAAEVLLQSASHPVAQSLAGHFALAIAGSLVGDETAAFAHWNACVAGRPRDSSILRAAALSGHAAGRSSAAARLLDRVAALEPLDTEDQLLRAQALAAADRHEEAYLQFEQLLEFNGNDPELWNQAGLAAFGVGRMGGDRGSWRRAARCFRRAQELDPQDVRFPFNLGCSLDWADDPSSAELAYRRSLELNPAHVAAGENLAILLNGVQRGEEGRSVLRALLRQPLTAPETTRVQARLSGFPLPN